ncbi:MAG: ROK family protein [Planctomyces sp.]|nr:ROK family protein [Planctomyces sp.]
MNVLVIDIGGRNAKVWRSGEAESIKIPSGKSFTPDRLLAGLERELGDWPVDRVSIGYPGEVEFGRPVKDPYNLGPGWADFDWDEGLGRPVKIMNDACMQALGSYEGGRMLFLGLGTSIGTTLVSDGQIIPLALGHLLFLGDMSFEDAVSRRALKVHGVKRWRKYVLHVASLLRSAFLVDYIVLGGGNAKRLTELPDYCRMGGNHLAYVGGVRMWEEIASETADGAALRRPDAVLSVG